MRYFRAMVNLQELKIMYLDFSKFPAGLGEHLGHFSPTLRSVALDRPRGTHRQLLDFFRLFPLLDDISVWQYSPVSEEYKLLDNQPASVRGGLRGRLKLHNLDDEGLLQDMVVAFEGMRFTSMDLLGVRGMRFLLETCAHTLETLCLHPEDGLDYCKRFPGR